MLLILDIALAILAWKREWGAKALIPLASSMGISFVMGLVLAVRGHGSSPR